jgi:YidC/Oxa1 family membrane protein insertase
MQQRNFVLFIALALFILMGWVWVQTQLWPQKARPKDDPVAKEKPPRPVKEFSAQVKHTLGPRLTGAVSPDATGLITAARWAVEIATAEQRVVPTPAEVWQKLTEAQRDQMLRLTALAAPLSGDVGATLQHLRIVWKPKPAADAEIIDLGGANYFIRAKVTTKGGGITSLTLPKFQKADGNGRPVVDLDTKQPVPMELVQEDPVVPSFLMYHFANPQENKDLYRPDATLGQRLWTIEEKEISDKGYKIVLSCDKIPKYEHLKIIKTFTLGPRDYHVGLAIEIRDLRNPTDDKKVPKFRYQIAGAHGIPIEGEWYNAIYRQPLIGTVDARDNLWRQDVETSLTQQRIAARKGGDRFPERDLGDSAIQFFGVSNQYYASVIVVDDQQPRREAGGRDRKNILEYVRPTLESEEQRVLVRKIDIPKRIVHLATSDKDTAGQPYQLLPRALESFEQLKIEVGEAVFVGFYDAFGAGLVVTELHRGREPRLYREDIAVRGASVPIELKPGEKVVHKYLLYNGPVKVALLGQFTGDKAVDGDLVARYTDKLHLATMTDYRSAGGFGWFAQTIRWTDLLIACTKLMHWLLDKLHYIIPNYGLSIILLTVVVRGLMFPISRKQALISIRMQELAPELKKLQEKYKTDPQGRHQAMMELYRKHGVNPLGGCLPLLMQLPIFLGLYYALQESIHFRLASFLWIDNLAAPDMFYRWGEGIPWLTDPDNIGSMLYLGPYLNLLPIFAVALMVVQQKLMTPPAMDEQQAFQQKMMKWMMIFFGILFYKVAAGLCIYFIASSLWGLAERRLLPKKRTAPTETASVGGSGSAKSTNGSPSRPSPSARQKQRGGKKEKQPDTAITKVKNWWQDILKKAAEKK